jgi:hypothetical protein
MTVWEFMGFFGFWGFWGFHGSDEMMLMKVDRLLY